MWQKSLKTSGSRAFWPPIESISTTHIGLFPEEADSSLFLRGVYSGVRNLAETRDPWRVGPKRPKLARCCPFSPGHLQVWGAAPSCDLFGMVATPNRPALVAGVSGRCSSSSEAHHKRPCLRGAGSSAGRRCGVDGCCLRSFVGSSSEAQSGPGHDLRRTFEASLSKTTSARLHWCLPA